MGDLYHTSKSNLVPYETTTESGLPEMARDDAVSTIVIVYVPDVEGVYVSE